MAFFYNQRQRLLRESWTADALAQEIFAMMSPDSASSTQGPVNVTLPQGSTVAPIEIGNVPDGSPVFNIRRSDGTMDIITIDGGQFNFNGKPMTTVVGGGGGGSSSVVPVWG